MLNSGVYPCGSFDLFYCCEKNCLCEIVKEHKSSAAVRCYHSDGQKTDIAVFRFRKSQNHLSWDFEFECSNRSESEMLSEKISEVLDMPYGAVTPMPTSALKVKRKQSELRRPASRGR